MELEVLKPRVVDDGMHKGEIADVSYRTEPYAYTDLHIELADKMVLKVGYPTVVMKDSKLGKLLARFGTELVEGKNVNPDVILIGQKVQFQTITEATKKGNFAKIIPESVKPIQ